MRNEVDVVLQTNIRKQIHRESPTTRLDDNRHLHLKLEKKAATRPVLSQPSGGLRIQWS